ncbi:uncharacterized protein KGF55_005478 [Candida pseudojiufengensis]|uniref:uncharacterized protein n=1 Tax=Candida pseudojiufengensis TaxID=497109 RepID=UPI00222537DC|nr:uncharacterized protein KGF55_005478 [Candida pseudojiufengensis]KAI5959135.1 hypothetical protein KGF55_005478 [Candida pseudojiufengensis]
MSKNLIKIIKPSSLKSLISSNSKTKQRIIPIDSTWYMPNTPKNAFEEYKQQHLPNAKFFDLDKYVRDSAYPHMLPTQTIINQAYKDLNIHKNDILVVYDQIGNFSSPRCAFTFKLGGHENVNLLDNFNTYQTEGYEITSEIKEEKEPQKDEPVIDEPIESNEIEKYEENYNNEVIEYEDIIALLENDQIQNYLVIDARSNDRFTGASPEPRPGLSSGHIPTAKNLPFTKLLDSSKQNQYKTKEEIIKELETIDININNLQKDYPNGIIVMCGTGVTACILKLAFESIVELDVPIKLYDGSWTEWAMRAPDKYIVKDV